MSSLLVNFFANWVMKSRSSENTPGYLSDGQASPIAAAQLSIDQLAAEKNDDTQPMIDLLRRVYLLHWQTVKNPENSSTMISGAFSLWQELKEQEVVTPCQSTKSDSEKWLFLSSLFIWLHLIVHPEEIESQRVQSMVTNNLPHILQMSAQSVSIVHSLLIPLFFHGITSIEDSDREIILKIILILEPRIDYHLFHAFRSEILKAWRRYDEGIERSWNWIKRAPENSFRYSV